MEYMEALNRDRQRDQEREAQILALECREEVAGMMEERRLNALMERCSHLCPETVNGIRIQLKYCDCSIRSRRFLPTESLQNLMDYAGNYDSASEVFFSSMPSAGTRLLSTMTGTLAEHYLTTPCTLCHSILCEICMNAQNHEPNMEELPEEDHTDLMDSAVNTRRAIEILQELTNKTDRENRHSSNMINACRDDIYGSAQRAFSRCLFDPHKALGVVFMDLGNNPEGAVDEGGPSREFCHLLLKDVQHRSLFEGPDNSKLLALDSHALSKGDYKLFGKIISICLIHGGVAPHCFAPRLLSSVRRSLSRINARKAPGPYNIPGRVLRDCAAELTEVFTDIFNISLSQAVVPTYFKATTIIPVPKKSSPSCFNDYRPVALTPILMKCFERLVMHNIKSAPPLSSLDPFQFAYRSKRSTDDAIATTLHAALTHLDKKDSYVRMLFIDFSSAFNTIIPQQLTHKLFQLGLNASLCNWLLDFLTGRPQAVRVGSNTSSTITLNTGAPQVGLGDLPKKAYHDLHNKESRSTIWIENRPTEKHFSISCQ